MNEQNLNHFGRSLIIDNNRSSGIALAALKTIWHRGQLRQKLLAMALLLLLPLSLSSCAWLGWSFLRAPSVTYHDTSWCVPLRLKTVLRQVSRRFGPVVVSSTHRWPLENKRKGGKPRSYHLSCRASDFRIVGDPNGVIKYLRNHPHVGGYKRYRAGFYHIDTGPKRTW